jgi:transposase
MPIRFIARQLGIGRNTVRRALASDGPPKYQRPAKGSIVDAVEPQIRQLLAQWPTMPATVTAERISSTRSQTVLKGSRGGSCGCCSPHRTRRRGPTTGTELAQCDLWFSPVDISLGSDSSAGRRCWSW